MISFELFSKEEIKILVEEGFFPEFLRIPFSHPHPSLNKLVPNGFRINKLKSAQIVKIYCDALKSNKNVLSDYIDNEINHQFDDSGITDYLKNKLNDENYLSCDNIIDTSEMLWKATLHIPAHFVFMLNGVKVSDELKEISQRLYSAHYLTLDKAAEDARKAGYDKGTELLDEKTRESEKQIDNLRGNLSAAQKKIADAIAKTKRETDEKDRALSEVESCNKQIEQYQDQIERKNTLITQYENDIQHYKEHEKQLRELGKDNKQLKAQIAVLDKDLSEKKAALELAKQDTYSEEALKQLVSDVVDEMKASTLSREEILDLARTKFKNNETIRDGWNSISSQTDKIIQKIISAFDNKRFDSSLLDDIEALEDNVLIKCAVIKSMKAVLYKELESESHSVDLGERFDQ